MSWIITPTYDGLVDDADAATYLAAVEAADGQILEPSVRQAVNTFVKGCKADGIWDAIKASCILAGARTLNGALQPLVGTAPTNRGFTEARYSRKAGLAGDNASRLNTNINRNALPINSCHFAAWRTVQEPTNKVSWIIGAGSGSGVTGATHYAVGSALVFRHSSLANDGLVPQQPGVGLAAASRFNSSQYLLFANGSQSTRNLFSNGAVNANFYVFNTQDSEFESSGGTCAFYSIGEHLNLSLLNARVATLINALAAAIP